MMSNNIQTTASTMQSTIIASEDGNNTYLVKRTFPERTGNKALFIQLYPTLTAKDIDTMDNTMLHLMNHLDDLNLKEIAFANLFSKVCKARPSVTNLGIDEENLNQIKQFMQQEDFKDYYIVFAWGSSMKDNEIANEMKRRIIKMYWDIVPKGVLWQLTADDIYLMNDSATHVLYMGIRHKRSKWKLEPYLVPLELQPEETEEKPNRKKDKQQEIKQNQGTKQADKKETNQKQEDQKQATTKESSKLTLMKGVTSDV